MEFEYWWLLGFPLFFGLGWIAARIDIKQIVSESRALPRSYFKGLNFLLNEQPDKAIEAFIEVVKVDPETIELHFALGSLFRRRGEYDRAIRMHQNLLERADLAGEQKLQAQMELGQDYLKAGILDRAEEVFSRLEKTAQAMAARRALLRDLRAGEGLAARHRDDQAGRDRPARARAVPVRARGSPKRRSRGPMRRGATSTRRWRRTASACAPACCGATSSEARTTWRRRWSTGSASSRRIPPTSRSSPQRLVEAYRDAGRAEEGLTLLAGYLERYPSLDLLDTVFQQTLEAKGPDEGLRAGARRAAPQPDAARPRPPARGADHRRRLARQAPRPGAGEEPGARPYPAPRPLPLRELRLQGAPVPLAVPGLRRLGDLSAAPHRGIRSDAMKDHRHRNRLCRPGHRRLPRGRRQQRSLPGPGRAKRSGC